MTGPYSIIASAYDYQTYDSSIEKTVSFRQVSMERDLGRLYQWLASSHVKPYWQLDLSLPAFRAELEAKLADDHLTPYIGYLDHIPMSYWECYWAAEDDLANYYDADPADQGVHLLIGPEEYLGHGYALPLMRAIVAMQFRHQDTDRVVAEPDARNERVITVFKQCGFEPQSEFYFEEAEKNALLLVCEREHFETEVLSDSVATSCQGVISND
ncbi:GNAT family N-acetyltransferase [Haloprofundus halobius]|uniref:GNAT family N-acetyltransferase n=1 Tax=Haloprofundus halobius TaxID=2876194 RepID=UPI001CCD3F8E|nr:GNAT family N-acetyltransferase [Haloprofundus halobius]